MFEKWCSLEFVHRPLCPTIQSSLRRSNCQQWNPSRIGPSFSFGLMPNSLCPNQRAYLPGKLSKSKAPTSLQRGCGWLGRFDGIFMFLRDQLDATAANGKVGTMKGIQEFRIGRIGYAIWNWSHGLHILNMFCDHLIWSSRTVSPTCVSSKFPFEMAWVSSIHISKMLLGLPHMIRNNKHMILIWGIRIGIYRCTCLFCKVQYV